MERVRSHWTLGIDPGYGMMGVVLLDRAGDTRTTWTLGSPPGAPEYRRAVSAAVAVACTVDQWAEMLDAPLWVGIEVPFYNNNAPTYAKQVRLVQELEHQLAGLQACDRIYEVAPATSKRALTGDGRADKAAMVAASPFAGRVDMSRESREALADAYGHALAVRTGRLLDYIDTGRAT